MEREYYKIKEITYWFLKEIALGYFRGCDL